MQATIIVVSILYSVTMYSAIADTSDASSVRRGIAEAVLKAWRQRQEATRELSFAWTSENYQLYSPADMTANMLHVLRGGEPEPIPESGETSLSGGRIWYGQGDEIRFDLTRSQDAGGDFQEVFSDGSLTLFFPAPPAGHPTASIMADRVSSAHNSAPALPLRLLFRPFLESAGFHGIDEAQCMAMGLMFEGTRCDLLVWNNHEVWVSSDEYRMPVRYVWHLFPGSDQAKADKRYTDIAIRYESAKRELPVPVGWTITHFGVDGETVVQSHDVTLTEYDFVNPPPPETFTIEFPHGTVVRDRDNGETYIVREKKPNRIVREGEFNGDNYDQLLNSDMPITPQEIATKSTVNWIWVGNGLIIAIILFLLYRRHVQT